MRQVADGALADPRSFTALGWLLVGLAGLLVVANQVLDFYKKHIRQDIPKGDWASRADLTATRLDLEQQVKDVRAYAHQEVHGVREDLQGMRVSADAGREGIQNRINALMELTHHMRGQMEGMLLAQRDTAQAAQRAASAAEFAVKRYHTDSHEVAERMKDEG